MPKAKPIPSAPMHDGISAFPGEKIVHNDELLHYIAISKDRPKMMIAGRESGERLLVHPLHCTTGEGEDDQAPIW